MWSALQSADVLQPHLLQVEEMSKAVDVAEKNTARFGLTQAEIASRRKWIMQTTREVCRLVTLLAAATPAGACRAVSQALMCTRCVYGGMRRSSLHCNFAPTQVGRLRCRNRRGMCFHHPCAASSGVVRLVHTKSILPALTGGQVTGGAEGAAAGCAAIADAQAEPRNQ